MIESQFLGVQEMKTSTSNMELQGKESLKIEFHFLLMGDRFGPSILESAK